MKKVIKWLSGHPSILIGALLMLASSGLDGAYLTLLMPRDVPLWGLRVSFGFLGLILNLAADGTDLYLSHRIGKYMRSRDAAKHWGGVALLLLGLSVTALFSWYLSYLQLRRIMPGIEAVNPDAIAKRVAAYIPSLLVILGFEDGLNHFSTKRFIDPLLDRDDEQEPEPIKAEPEPLRCEICGATETQSGKPFLSQAQLSGHKRMHAGNGHQERTLEILE